jgi:microcystin-dependent protein
MSDPYVGEIRMAGFNFPPQGWASCNGALIPISENEVLFTLIGTTYGGDGQNTFALPDLQGRVPVHMGQGSGSNFTIGQKAGEEQVTITQGSTPTHTHPVLAQTANGTQPSPSGAIFAASVSDTLYNAVDPSVNMNAGLLPFQGGNQPHDNMVPFLVINFIISLFGIFPTPT